MVIELTGWRSPEVGADELGDAAFGVGQQQVGGVGGGEASRCFGVAQDLADFGFQTVEEFAYPASQAGGFALQDVAAKQSHETGVALREGQHQGEDLAALLVCARRLLGDAVDAGEQAFLDEFDQGLKHLRLAGEVPVEGRFGDADVAGDGGCGDARAGCLLQHGGEGLQDLLAAVGAGHGSRSA